MGFPLIYYCSAFDAHSRSHSSVATTISLVAAKQVKILPPVTATLIALVLWRSVSPPQDATGKRGAPAGLGVNATDEAIEMKGFA
jgi:hypothetical protein